MHCSALSGRRKKEERQKGLKSYSQGLGWPSRRGVQGQFKEGRLYWEGLNQEDRRVEKGSGGHREVAGAWAQEGAGCGGLCGRVYQALIWTQCLDHGALAGQLGGQRVYHSCCLEGTLEGLALTLVLFNMYNLISLKSLKYHNRTTSGCRHQAQGADLADNFPGRTTSKYCMH